MFNIKHALLALAMILAGNLYCACGISWVPHRETAFPGIRTDGSLVFVEPLGEISLSSGENIPLFAHFGSSRRTSSPFLGFGWKFNISDFTLSPSGPNAYKAFMPDGMDVELRELSDKRGTYGNGKSAGHSTLFLSGGTEQMALTAKCGPEARFKNGLLRRYKSPAGALVNFLYKNGRLAEISEKNNILISFEYLDDGNAVLLKSKKENKTVKLSFENIPQSKIGKILTRIEDSEGETAFTYDFSDRTFWSVRRRHTTKNAAFDESFAWNSGSGAVSSQNIAGGDSYSYSFRGGDYGGTVISRISGKTGKEDVYYLSRKGYGLTRESGGPTVETFGFMLKQLFNKPRRQIVTHPDGKKDVRLFHYDDKGRISREILNGKPLYNIRRNDKEMSTACYDGDWNFVWKKFYDKEGRTITYEKADGSKTSFKYLDNGLVEASMELDGKKTVSIFNKNLNQMTNNQ